MMTILKITFLNVFWFIAVKFGSDYSVLIWSSALILALIYSKAKSLGLTPLIFMGLWGYSQDSLLINLGLMNLDTAPLWLNSLWLLFIGYFPDLFSKFSKLNNWALAFIGGLGGVAAYYSGTKIAEVPVDNYYLFLTVVFISWSLFFPMVFSMIYRDLMNRFLDKTILFSFDKLGYLRHSKKFKNTLIPMKERSILVTGGTSGIGHEVTNQLADLGSKVFFAGRNEKKGAEISSDLKVFKKLDLADWNAIDLFCKESENLDGVVLNAGAMPDELTKNSEGVEMQAATQLFGHYRLILGLKKNGKLNPGARITWVSSGGMYLSELMVGELVTPSKYDKANVYANVKRAQVTLCKKLSNLSDWDSYKISSMHPGWVDTPGLQDALPIFCTFMTGRLRTIAQGADTITWLQSSDESIENGKFYFDREAVSPYVSDKYIPKEEQINELMDLINRYGGSGYDT